MAKDNKKDKKLVMAIPTAGKTKEEITKEAIKVLREKGLLKEKEEKEEPQDRDDRWEDMVAETFARGNKPNNNEV